MSNLLVLEGEKKYTQIGLVMVVKIGGDAAKSGKNTNLSVVMGVRLLQKMHLLELTNWTWFKKETAIKYVRKVCPITNK